MFGLVVMDGMKWNRVVNKWIPLFGSAKNEWNETHSIQYHHSFNFSFLPIWGVCNGINFYN
jgi:hypothetical protein